MKKIEQLLLMLEKNIHNHQQFNSDISEAPVGWHIEHSLLTISVIIDALKKSDPAKFKYSFKLAKVVVFGLNKIPRGRGKAPKVVQPKNYDADNLVNHLKVMKTKVLELQSISPNQHFQHPYFGNLKLRETIRFLEIHTKHHYKIIEDIIKKR
jgi:hypothetical protein